MLIRKLFSKWPEDKPKAAIFYLAELSRVKTLIKSLKSLDTFFNDKFHYPVIIFHEADMVHKLHKVRSSSSSNIFFQEVDFSIPESLTMPIPFKIPCTKPIGYRHMCRFNSKGVYEQPIMWGIDYYWRLDDDSLVLGNITYDVFKYMRDNHLLYGYNFLTKDSTPCVADLWKGTRDFVKKKNLKTHFFEEFPEPNMYYTNFEISAMSIWRDKNYKEYIDHIDRLGGIYIHRWGDAPIKSIAISLFVPKKKLHKFTNIPYKHQEFEILPDRGTLVYLYTKLWPWSKYQHSSQ